MFSFSSWVFLSVGACGVCLNCVQPTTSGRQIQQDPRIAAHCDDAEVRARALTEFSAARFSKPREGSMSKFAQQLAPLLVDEWPISVVSDHGEQVVSTNCDDGFGAVTGWSVGHVEVDEAAPTVYAATSNVTIHGNSYRQVVYVWWYATCAERETAARPTPHRAPQGAEKERERAAQMRGVRITLGRDGFPVVWELLGGDCATGRLFVSRSMELAAAEAFGGPLPGRRFCVERSIEQAPTTTVVRILEDGPVPMGPYVYLQAEDHTVTTLLCRCSPAQVDRFVQERFYDLRPLEALGPLGHRWLDSPPDLAGLLRWPDGI